MKRTVFGVLALLASEVAFAASPDALSVSPASGSGMSQTFTLRYSDADGGADMSVAGIIINSSFAVPSSCYINYYRVDGRLWLENDAGTAYVGSVQLGSAQTVENSQCKVSGAGSSAVVAGSNLTVTIPLTFKQAFGGARNVYLSATDTAGHAGPWEQLGTWHVPVSVSPAGLKGHWPLNGNGLDASGHGNNLALSSTSPTSNRFGAASGALGFTHSNYSYARLSDGTSSDLASAFTLAGWIRFAHIGNSVETIAQKSDGGSNAQSMFQFDTYGNAAINKVRYRVMAGASAFGSSGAGPTLTNGVWYHVAFTYNAATGAVRFYLNGTQQHAAGAPPGTVLNNVTHPFYLGFNQNTSPANGTLGGAMDDVYWYSRELPAAEIAELAGVSSGPLKWLALGDSYSSGEGAGDYDPGTDIRYQNQCHRSNNAWSGPTPGGQDGALVLPEGTVRELVACSGSRSRHLWEPRFFGKNGAGDNNHNGLCDDGEPCVTSQFDESSLLSTASLITLTSGGNDLQAGDRDDAVGMFASVVMECVLDSNCTPLDPHGAETIGDLILRTLNHLNSDVDTVGSFRNTLRQLKSLAAPNARIIVMNYPALFWLDPVGSGCADEGFDSNEMEWLNDLAIDLQSLIACAAIDQGVLWVPVTFGEHAICVDSPPASQRSWFEGANYNLSWKRRQESLHPNPLGQIAFADALRRVLPAGGATGVLPSLPAAVPCSWIPGQWLPAVVGAGAGVPTLDGALQMEAEVAGCGLVDDRFVPGQTVLITGNGFEPLSSASVQLSAAGGAYQRSLGQVVSDAGGAISMSLNLPADAPVEGLARLRAEGAVPGGNTLLLSRLFVLGQSNTPDSDGDGVPDLCDNCQVESNAAQSDGDGDGLGDVCDVCGLDAANDFDADGLCAPEDPCPLDPLNDADGDDLCAESDSCPTVPNLGCYFADGFEASDACAWSTSVGGGCS